MKNEKYLNCFFCQGKISTICRTETRTHCGDHYSGDTQYDVKVAIPAETDLIRISFEPKYKPLLENSIKEAEADIKKIIDSACNAADKILKKYNKELGSKNKVYPTEDRFGDSPEKRREQAASDIYHLRWLKYELKDTDEIKINNSWNQKYLLAHKSCAKSEVILEEVLENPIIKKQFREKLAELPKPMQNIYQQLKKEKVEVKTEPFDFRALL
jgi:hypothetical protein